MIASVFHIFTDEVVDLIVSISQQGGQCFQVYISLNVNLNSVSDIHKNFQDFLPLFFSFY